MKILWRRAPQLKPVARNPVRIRAALILAAPLLAQPDNPPLRRVPDEREITAGILWL